MTEPYVSRRNLVNPDLRARIGRETIPPPLQLNLELTARCNNNCRHCYINLPAGDTKARRSELSLNEIKCIADEAVAQGTLWCLLTGGEPLLRDDFIDIYTYLRRKGLLVSVFTNATLVTEEHVELFLKHPPRDLEVTVYGATEHTYEAVTRTPGSYQKFRRGLSRLLGNGIKVTLKAMALRSNLAELPEIARFCRSKTKGVFRFDPWLHLRCDRDPLRNEEIKAERVSVDEFIAAEREEEGRFQSLKRACNELIQPPSEGDACDHLFHWGAGRGMFAVDYNGVARPCLSLTHPACTYDLRQGNLFDAYYRFFPQVLEMRSRRPEFKARCRTCQLINLCLWCPAHSYLETGELDTPVDYFCQIAHARAQSLGIVVEDARLPADTVGPVDNHY